MRENFDIFDFELAPEDMDAITGSTGVKRVARVPIPTRSRHSSSTNPRRDLGPMPRYSLPTMNWLDLPDGSSLFSLEEILDAAAAAGFESVGLDTVTRPARPTSLGCSTRAG